MAEISQPKEYLQEALAQLEALGVKKAKYEEDRRLLDESEQSLNLLKKTIEQEKKSTLESRRADIENEYTKQIRQCEEKKSKLETEREKTRRVGVEERVKNETSGLNGEITGLKNEIAMLVKNGQLPGFCKWKVFYKLFHPKHISEVIVMILVMAVCLALIPSCAILTIEEKVWRIVVFAAIDLFFILIYLLIYRKTVAKNPDAVQKCHDLFDRIAFDKKQIAEVSRRIRADKDDSSYGLEGIDQEIGEQAKAIDDLTLRKKEALNLFDRQTSVSLSEEIDKRYAEQLEASQTAVDGLTQSVKADSETITEAELAMNNQFTQFIGAGNMTREKIETMVQMLEEKTANSVADAVAKLNEKK